jgi:hypothetical protein
VVLPHRQNPVCPRPARLRRLSREAPSQAGLTRTSQRDSNARGAGFRKGLIDDALEIPFHHAIHTVAARSSRSAWNAPSRARWWRLGLGKPPWLATVPPPVSPARGLPTDGGTRLASRSSVGPCSRTCHWPGYSFVDSVGLSRVTWPRERDRPPFGPATARPRHRCLLDTPTFFCGSAIGSSQSLFCGYACAFER